MITPFRLAKNKILKSGKYSEAYFRASFNEIYYFFENIILEQYSISNNDIKENRLENIKIFIEDFFKETSIENHYFKIINYNIEGNRISFNKGQFETFKYMVDEFFQVLNDLKKNYTKKEFLIFFNLIPIREPKIM